MKKVKVKVYLEPVIVEVHIEDEELDEENPIDYGYAAENYDELLELISHEELVIITAELYEVKE